MANIRKAWFVGRETGLGMRPASWQGWLLAGVLFAWIAGGMAIFARGLPADDRLFAFGLWLAVAGSLLLIMRRRTAPPR